LLIASLKDENKEVRVAAINSLGKLGRGVPEAEEALKNLISDTDPEIRTKVALALANFGTVDESIWPVIFKALGSADDHTIRIAVTVLRRIISASPDKIIPAFVDALESDQKTLGSLLKLIENSRLQNALILERLVKVFPNASAANRVHILNILTAMDENGNYATPLIVQSLVDKNPALKKAAFHSLIRFPDILDKIKPVIWNELKDPDSQNRPLVINLLEQFRDKFPEGPDEVLNLVNDPNLQVRLSALSALGSLGTPATKAMEVLEKALHDPDARVRNAAISSLGNLGKRNSSEVIPVLERALRTENDPRVKDSIVSALNRLGRKMPASASGVPWSSEKKRFIPGEELGGN